MKQLEESGFQVGGNQYLKKVKKSFKKRFNNFLVGRHSLLYVIGIIIGIHSHIFISLKIFIILVPKAIMHNFMFGLLN